MECQVEDCTKPHLALGYCKNHYRKFKRWGDPLYVQPKQADKPCSVDGCETPAFCKGLCKKHDYHSRVNGDPEYRHPKFDHPETCCVKGCEKPYVAKGFCGTHYQSLNRGRDPHRVRPTTDERFLSMVEIPDDPEGCWRWSGRFGSTGCAIFDVDRITRRRACRYSYQMFVGPIERGIVIVTCDNPGCVNPLHLEDVTSGDKSRRWVEANITECRQGHPLDGLLATTGLRYCRTCNSDRQHIRRTCYQDGESIDIMSLGERDNWTCYLCGEVVDPECKGRTSRSRSIDHIVPVSKGGEHVWSNVALAHFGCNSSRGNRS